MPDFRGTVQRLGANLIRGATGAFGSEPSNPVAGDLYLPNNGMTAEQYSGSAWANWGPLYPFTKPDAVANWTWVNQGSATATDEKGTIPLIVPAGAGNNVRGLFKTAPATPWTVTACFSMLLASNSTPSAGLYFRQSSDGKLAAWLFTQSAGTQILLSGKYTNATTYSANYTTAQVGAPSCQTMWLQIADNGTNRICSWSPNGLDWVAIHTVGRTDFLTADQYGFAANAVNATFGITSRLLSLVVS